MTCRFTLGSPSCFAATTALHGTGQPTDSRFVVVAQGSAALVPHMLAGCDPYSPGANLTAKGVSRPCVEAALKTSAAWFAMQEFTRFAMQESSAAWFPATWFSMRGALAPQCQGTAESHVVHGSSWRSSWRTSMVLHGSDRQAPRHRSEAFSFVARVRIGPLSLALSLSLSRSLSLSLSLSLALSLSLCPSPSPSPSLPLSLSPSLSCEICGSGQPFEEYRVDRYGLGPAANAHSGPRGDGRRRFCEAVEKSPLARQALERRKGVFQRPGRRTRD